MRFTAVGKRVRALAVVAVVCLVAVVVCSQVGEAYKDSRQLDPIATSGGKPVVLIFLRTDCPISKRYAPTIHNLAAKFDGKATFWLVFPSKDDSIEIIAGHTREFGYRLGVLRDPDHNLVSRAKATITPEAAVFDANGALKYHGRIDNLYVSFGHSRQAPTTHDLDDALAAVLAGKSVDHAVTPAVGCYISDVK